MAFGNDALGLCKNCGYHREIKNARGSSFHLCRLAAKEPRFPKYPRLPVLRCAGYAPHSDRTQDLSEPERPDDAPDGLP